MNTLVTSIKELIGYSTHNGLKLPYVFGLLGGKAFDFLSFVTGKKLPVSSIRVKKFCANTRYSSGRMKTAGFTPPYSIEEGLKNTILFEFLQN